MHRQINKMRTSGASIPSHLTQFKFRGAPYRTLHVAAGFTHLAMTVKFESNPTRYPGKEWFITVFADGKGGTDYLYPAEVTLPRQRPLTNSRQEVEIQIDRFSAYSALPIDVQELVEEAWRGSLLPKSCGDEILYFKDRGVSVHFEVREPLELMTDKGVPINFTALLVGESMGDQLPRYAALWTFTHLTIEDVLKNAFREAQSSVAAALVSSGMPFFDKPQPEALLSRKHA